MYSVELMVDEHKNILRLLKVVQNACCGILDSKELITDDFRQVIEFARNYADKHHHGKEEEIMFKEMTEHLGAIGNNLIQHGMLVEHDLGRLHISELEKALNQYDQTPDVEFKLNILTEAMGYVNLLRRHIEKEDAVVYTYAEKNLSAEILQSVDQRVKDFEISAEKNKVQEKYLGVLKTLENKYS